MSIEEAIPKLVGETIINIHISKDKQYLFFTLLDYSTVILSAEKRGCSDTWIEHIELPAKGLPAKVLEIRDLELKKVYEGIPKRSNVAQFYGMEIVTNKGSVEIDYRNYGNGYYGGELFYVYPEDVVYHFKKQADCRAVK